MRKDGMNGESHNLPANFSPHRTAAGNRVSQREFVDWRRSSLHQLTNKRQVCSMQYLCSQVYSLTGTGRQEQKFCFEVGMDGGIDAAGRPPHISDFPFE